METVISQRKKIWHNMPNIEHERRKDYALSGSLRQYSIQNIKSSPFIVDWQMEDETRSSVQLSLF